MKLQRVIFKNFKSYADEDTELDLSFIGKKLISAKNGHGKTSVIDAIVWCLFGKTMGSADSVVNRVTKKNCKVELRFSVNGTNYSLIRYRKHEDKGNKILLFKNNKDITMKNADEIQKQISEVTGLTYTSFVSSCVFSTETYTQFLRAKPSDRLKVVESILPLGFIPVYIKQLKKLMKPIEEKIEEKKDEFKHYKSTVSSLEDSKKEYLAGAAVQIAKLKEDKVRLENKIEILEEQKKALQVVNVEEELRKIEVTSENEKTEDTIKTLKKSIIDTDFISKKIAQSKKQLKELESINIEEELSHIENYNQLVERRKQLLPLIEEKNKINNEYKVKKAKLTDLLNELERNKKKIESFKTHIETCPTCGQLIDKEKQEIILEGYRKEKDKLNVDIQEISSKEFYYLANEKELQELIGEESLTHVLAPNYEKDYLISLPGKIINLISTIEDDEKQLSEVIENNNETLNTIQALKQKIITIDIPSFSKEELMNIKSTIKNKDEEIQKINLELEGIKAKALTFIDKTFVKKLEKSIKENEEILISIQDELKNLVYEKNHFDAMYDLLSNGDSGFKKFFINKILNIFNERINMYLPYFFNEEISISFDKNLAETIVYDGDEIEFSTLSSGQKTRVEIAIALSLFVMVKTFFSTNISFLVFDEILDWNLDNDGIKAVSAILEDISKTNTVFVISHNESLKEKFQEVIIIKRKGKFSYVEF